VRCGGVELGVMAPRMLIAGVPSVRSLTGLYVKFVGGKILVVMSLLTRSHEGILAVMVV